MLEIVVMLFPRYQSFLCGIWRNQKRFICVVFIVGHQRIAMDFDVQLEERKSIPHPLINRTHHQLNNAPAAFQLPPSKLPRNETTKKNPRLSHNDERSGFFFLCFGAGRCPFTGQQCVHMLNKEGRGSRPGLIQ